MTFTFADKCKLKMFYKKTIHFAHYYNAIVASPVPFLCIHIHNNNNNIFIYKALKQVTKAFT